MSHLPSNAVTAVSYLAFLSSGRVLSFPLLLSPPPPPPFLAAPFSFGGKGRGGGGGGGGGGRGGGARSEEVQHLTAACMRISLRDGGHPVLPAVGY